MDWLFQAAQDHVHAEWLLSGVRQTV